MAEDRPKVLLEHLTKKTFLDGEMLQQVSSQNMASCTALQKAEQDSLFCNVKYENAVSSFVFASDAARKKRLVSPEHSDSESNRNNIQFAV